MTSRLFQLAQKFGMAAKSPAGATARKRAGDALRGQHGAAALAKLVTASNDQQMLMAANELMGLLGPTGRTLSRVLGPLLSSSASPQALQERRMAVAEILNQVSNPSAPRTSRNLPRWAQEVLNEIEQAEQPPAAAPPGKPPPSGPGGTGGGDDGWPEEHDIGLLGRGSLGYDPEAAARTFRREVRTPGSSNVYGFVYEVEEDAPQLRHRRRNLSSGAFGILYVTFKAWHPGQKERSQAAGATYAYFDVSHKKFKDFERLIEPGGKRAGEAVWNYLRVRGTAHGHQYDYRLAAGSTVPEGGVYIPRKATAGGLKKRSLAYHGTGRRQFRQSTLPEVSWAPRRGTPNRGTPNRGRP